MAAKTAKLIIRMQARMRAPVRGICREAAACRTWATSIRTACLKEAANLTWEVSALLDRETPLRTMVTAAGSLRHSRVRRARIQDLQT